MVRHGWASLTIAVFHHSFHREHDPGPSEAPTWRALIHKHISTEATDDTKLDYTSSRDMPDLGSAGIENPNCVPEGQKLQVNR